MQAKCIFILVVLVALISSVSSAAASEYSLWLRAQPQAIVADSFSTTTITADVRDEDGHAVPDGTQVDFTTSLGIIDHISQTTSGIARVRLQSSATVGTAMISAVVANGRAVAQLNVDFLAPGTEMFDESFILVSSDNQLGYDVGGKIVDAAGGVKIYHRGLTITAEEAQIDVKKNILRARARLGGENIIIKKGDKEIAASALYYDFNKMNGVLLTPADDCARRMLFRGRDAFIEPDQKPNEKLSFDFEPVEQANMFIRAKSLVIRPGEEIKIKRANFYMEGDKVLSVPLHVVSLSGHATSSQLITYGTEGLQMDLPLYYSLTPNGTGSFRLRHSDPSGWGSYSGRGGWQIDLDQEYTLGGSAEGNFRVNRITSGDWGLSWNDRREFDNDSRLYTYLDFPSHENLYGTLNYSRDLGKHTMSINLRGNMLSNSTNRYSSMAYVQSRSKPIFGGAISYAYTTKLSFDNYSSSEDSSRFGSGLGLQLYGKPIKMGKGSINTSLTAFNGWGGSLSGSTIYANAGYNRSLGMIGSFGLNYAYCFGNSDDVYREQRLSGDVYLSPSRLWSSRINATYGLTNDSISAFGDFGYSIRPTWRLSIQNTYQKYTGGKYTDYEIALAKALGRQEARIIWSQSRKRFRVEFSALSF
jgi:hypothetical protein